MPSGDVYPLEMLLAVRRREEEGRQRDLAEMLARAAAAKARAAAAEARVRAARERRECATHDAAERASAGYVSAGDMTRARQFEERLRLAEREAEAEVETAHTSLSAAGQAVERARSALEEAAGARLAAEKHEERWRTEQGRRRQRREEAETDDRRDRRDPC